MSAYSISEDFCGGRPKSAIGLLEPEDLRTVSFLLGTSNGPVAVARESPLSGGQTFGSNAARTRQLNFGLLGDLKCIFHLDSEIPHGALNFCVTK